MPGERRRVAVLFPEADGDEAGKCLERVLLELEATEVGPIACVSASAGIATYRRRQRSEQLLAEAGEAMDRARAEGGARAVLLDAASSRSLAEDAAQRDAVSGLAVALLERDRYTGEHSESVVELAVR